MTRRCGESRGTTIACGRWKWAGWASRRSPGSLARSARPRSRTSAPTARTSRRRSPPSGSGTARSAGSARSPTPTAGSATGTRGSRRTPAGTSYSTSPSSSPRATSATPIAYAELARALGVEIGARVPMADVREAVLELRRGKGMVLDADDHDTWSAGSFFTNPVIDPAEVPEGAPDLARRGRGEDERCLADRARRLRQGLRRRPHRRPREPLDQAHARADQPWRRDERGPALPGPRPSATGSSRPTASGWSTSRCCSAASSEPKG